MKILTVLTTVIILLLGLLYTKKSFSQNASRTMAITAGASTADSKITSISFEKTRNGYRSFGVTFSGIFYSNNENKNIDSKYENVILALELRYKLTLSSTKNFNTAFFFGGAAGSDGKSFFYYPLAGFEQNIFISKGLQLTINQEIICLLGEKDLNNWQPILNAGFKISL